MAPTASRSAAEFARFRAHVWADAGLGARLRAFEEEEAFVAAAVREGRDTGFDFGAADVRAALAEGRRRWIERWMV